jgi:hypothetical protein
MSPILFALVVSLLAINLMGLALLLRRWFPDHAIAKAAGVIGFVLVFFFIEHFAGLGRLVWMWPLTTAISLGLVWRRREELKAGLWEQELVFLIAFATALSWKYCFPDIDAQGEKLTELAFVNNYIHGDTLPPPDSWLPHFRFNVYYALQHYGAALLGRIMGLENGYALNLAFAVLWALLASLAWSVASRFSTSRIARIVLVAAVMVGGSGIAPLTHLVYRHENVTSREAIADAASDNVWMGMRFAGEYVDRVNTDLGKALFPLLRPEDRPTPDFESRALPLETIAYISFLGDYSPSLGGFLLLFVALAGIAGLEASPSTLLVPVEGEEAGSADAKNFALQMLLAATVPLTLAVNARVFPLQCILLLGWLIYRYVRKDPPDWWALCAGGLGALALIYPFFSQFASHGLSASIETVNDFDHTPWNIFIGLHWPILVLMVLTLFLVRRHRLALLAGVVFAVLLLLSEMLFLNQHAGPKYSRFDSVLAWWGWIYAGSVLFLGAICLSGGKWVRGIALAVLLAISTYAIDIGIYWAFSPTPSMGKMFGHAWLNRDSVDKTILEFLKAAPRGVVLESLDSNAYTPSSAFALFSGQSSLNGWPDHESLWRASPSYIAQNAERNRLFYRGNLPDAERWLVVNDVRYILWTRRDQQRQADARPRIDAQISGSYAWIAVWTGSGEELGYWMRK